MAYQARCVPIVVHCNILEVKFRTYFGADF